MKPQLHDTGLHGFVLCAVSVPFFPFLLWSGSSMDLFFRESNHDLSMPRSRFLFANKSLVFLTVVVTESGEERKRLFSLSFLSLSLSSRMIGDADRFTQRKKESYTLPGSFSAFSLLSTTGNFEPFLF